jgi:DNA-binding PadR family transcriptional regulator
LDSITGRQEAVMEKMSVVNLLVMGLLFERPMSAYEIAQIVDNEIIGRLVKVSSPAVYKNIKELQREGYLEVEKVKTGEMPEKKVYSATETGKSYFFTLMDYYSRNITNHYFDFNTLLINIDKVDKQKGLEMLNRLRDEFYRWKTWMVTHEQEARVRNVYFGGRAVIKQYRMVAYTLIAWIEEVIEEYRHSEDLGKGPF